MGLKVTNANCTGCRRIYGAPLIDRDTRSVCPHCGATNKHFYIMYHNICSPSAVATVSNPVLPIATACRKKRTMRWYEWAGIATFLFALIGGIWAGYLEFKDGE